MEQKIKRKWLSALRSGKFSQAKGRLKDGDAMCCLGVLAHIRGCEWKQGVPYLNGARMAAGPTSVLTNDNVGLTVGAQQSLAEMNDAGKSFKALAAYIEKNL